MIILGDVAVPNKLHVEKFVDICSEYFNDAENLIVNLEGLLSDKVSLMSNKSVIFNYPSLVEELKLRYDKNVLFCLANNHTLDVVEEFNNTANAVIKNGYTFLGACKDSNDRNDEVEFIEEGIKVYLFNYCWDFLLYHQTNPTKGVKIETIDFNKLEKRIMQIKSNEKQKHRIIIYFHWSFDLETIPLPYFRTFAKSLIDLGVSVVAGCHSHCVQGVESYNGGYIAHGIGNFYFPNGIYINGKLSFPEMSMKTVALKYDVESNNLKLIWFKGNGSNNKYNLKYIAENELENCDISKKYTKYNGLSDLDYLCFYNKNRRKKFLIPTFKSHKNHKENFFKMKFLVLRAKIARKLAELNLRKWQN